MVEGREHLDRFQDRDTVGPAAAQVVDLTTSRFVEESEKQPGNIAAMDWASPTCLPPYPGTVYGTPWTAGTDVGKEAMQGCGGVLRAGEAAAAKYAHRHVEIASVLLGDHVGRRARSAERVKTGIHGHGFVNAFGPSA